jgi:hypothetical protein
MGRAVGPVEVVGARTLGVAQGWDEFGPLALRLACRCRRLLHALPQAHPPRTRITPRTIGSGGVPAAPTARRHPSVYPTHADLADALVRLQAAGIPLDGASDHGVCEALYLRDPDGNGVELYWDRPESKWPRTPDGGLNMSTRHLDVVALLNAGKAG